MSAPLASINRARRGYRGDDPVSVREMARLLRGVDLPYEPPGFAIMSPEVRGLYLRDGETVANAQEGEPVIAGTTSSTDIDLYGTRMVDSAQQSMLADCRRNLSTFLNHIYEIPESILGSVRTASLTKRRGTTDTRVYTDLDLVTSVVGEDVNPRALKCWRAVRQKVKLGFSIGAYVLDWEWQLPDGTPLKVDKDDVWAMMCPPTDDAVLSITDLLLLESSLVAIPANRRSWVTDAARGIEASGTDISADAEGRWDAWRTARRLSWFAESLLREDPAVVRFVDELLAGQSYRDLNPEGKDALALRVADLLAAA